jgi:hypothetical protein
VRLQRDHHPPALGKASTALSTAATSALFPLSLHMHQANEFPFRGKVRDEVMEKDNQAVSWHMPAKAACLLLLWNWPAAVHALVPHV